MKVSLKNGSLILGITALFGAVTVAGKEIWDRHHYNADGFNNKGYNKEGFDREGFNQDDYDKDGYDRKGFHRFTRRDREGFDIAGYNHEGFNREGFDRAGYNSEGYNIEGFDRSNHNREYYVAYFTDELQPNYKKACTKMELKEIDYSLYHARIVLEELLRLLIQHFLGPEKLGKSILDNLKICEKGRLLSEDFLNRLHNVRKICNQNSHELNAERDFNRVYFSIKQVGELLDLVKAKLTGV